MRDPKTASFLSCSAAFSIGSDIGIRKGDRNGLRCLSSSPSIPAHVSDLSDFIISDGAGSATPSGCQFAYGPIVLSSPVNPLVSRD